ncbi:hypothetical protein JYK14_08960, partial [Siccirubricoccus sp. KC 17139]
APAAPWRGRAREVRALACWRLALPDPASLPAGQGRVVLVVPAFLTGDAFTAPLRRFAASSPPAVSALSAGGLG